MKVSVLGCGNVGVAISADLSINGHEVNLIKTSHSKDDVFDKIVQNGNKIILKENKEYKGTIVNTLSRDLSCISSSNVVIITIQSIYHEVLIEKISEYIKSDQVVICICSYMASFFIRKYCKKLPYIVETAGPYLEGRVEMNDIEGQVVFRVGCRLSKSPLSIFQNNESDKILSRIKELYNGFSADYSTIEAALLNPNMVLHTVGSIMSIPRIEYSHGNFCMYREAYSRENKATIKVMLGLDEEKKQVLRNLGYKPTDIFVAGGFLGEPIKSFYEYSESNDRAISPTSIQSRYITEDVSQGLVLLESIAKKIGVDTPITSALITIASSALNIDFRKNGRTIQKLSAESYIETLYNNHG